MGASELGPSDFADSNLLFAVLALQRGFLDQTRFVDACAAWAVRRDVPLPDLLMERHWLSPADKTQIEQDVTRLLQRHKGDVRASIQEVADDQVRQSLAHVFNDPSLEDLRPSEAVLTEQPGPRHTRERYVLLGKPKKGGIGQVWRAKDNHLGREVALKELRTDRLHNREQRERFLAEAQVTAQLTHPNIVPAFDLVHPAGGDSPFYTMQYIEGRTLTDAARHYHTLRKEGKVGNLEWRELLTAFVTVCKAVDYAHDRGVLHRDLKGINVILGSHGEVFVIDWGMAKVLSQANETAQATPVELATMDAGTETRQGELLGTPAYMAPEQAAGHNDQVDRRTDVYALGVILFEILTGQLPFQVADTPSLSEGLHGGPIAGLGDGNLLNRRKIERLLEQIIWHPPPAPCELQDQVPLALEKVCLKAIAKKKEDRYATAKDLARDIERWLANEPVGKIRRWVGRHRFAVTSAVVVVMVGLIAFTGVKYLRMLDERNNERDKWQSLKKDLDNERDKSQSLKKDLDKQRVWGHLIAPHLDWAVDAPGWLGAPVWCFSPDMQRKASGSTRNQIIKVWDARKDQEISLEGHTKGVTSLCFSADGKRLASASADQTVKVWDAENGKELYTLRGHKGEVQSLRFSADGERVTAVDESGTAKVMRLP
jgi:serine/threonine protein kinase